MSDAMPLKRFRSRGNACGFTLIEILVALFVFAILGTLAVVALRHVVDTRTRIQQDDDVLRQVQFAVVLMRNDLNQVIDRPVMDGGGGVETAMLAQGEGFALTRTGYVDPTSAKQRSDLQRVAYQLSGSNLVRQTWTVLDRTSASRPLTRVLIKGVTAMRVRYIDGQGREVPSWPLPTGSNIAKEQQSNLPRGIIIQLKLKRLGELSLTLPIAARGALPNDNAT